MTAQRFYSEVWIKEHADERRGDWVIRFAEAYAKSQLERLTEDHEVQGWDLRAAEIALAQVREERRWIPVEEKLPQEFENGRRWVLVYDKYWDAIYFATWLGDEWEPCEDREPGTITHWMPLPAAPLLSDKETVKP